MAQGNQDTPAVPPNQGDHDDAGEGPPPPLLTDTTTQQHARMEQQCRELHPFHLPESSYEQFSKPKEDNQKFPSIIEGYVADPPFSLRRSAFLII